MKALLAATASAVLLAFPASAQPICLPVAEMIERLADGYGESVIAMGRTPQGGTMGLLIGPTGSWTIIEERGGVACMVGHGHSFVTVPQGEDA